MRLLTVAVLSFFTLSRSPLAGAETSAQRGRRVVMDAYEALGGEKFSAMKDRVESGRGYSFYRDRLTGMAIAKMSTRYLDDPQPGQLAVRERQAYGKNEDQVVLYMPDGAGYELTFRGARKLPQDRLERYVDTTNHNVLYILRCRLKEPGLTFDSLGSDVVDNNPVEIVEISDSQNRVTKVFFHQSTKLPIRQIFYHRDPKTRERDEEVTLFSKYRDAGGGVRWPYAIQRERNGEKIFEMYSESVVINPGLGDHLFEIPNGMKKLDK